MAYNLMGNAPIARGNWRSSGLNWCFLDQAVPAPTRGVIKKFSVYMHGAGTFRLRIYRDDGVNYLFRGESPLYSCSAGLNGDLSCWIPVEKGDLIGCHIPSDGGQLECGTIGEGGSSSLYKPGDINYDTAKNTWTVSNTFQSIQAKIFTRVQPL